MAKSDDVVEVVFVVDDPIVESEGADVDALLVAFLFPILSNRAKFFRVNRARLSCCSALPPSLSIRRFRSLVAGETSSGPSTSDSRDEAYGRSGDSGFGCCGADCTN